MATSDENGSLAAEPPTHAQDREQPSGERRVEPRNESSPELASQSTDRRSGLGAPAERAPTDPQSPSASPVEGGGAPRPTPESREEAPSFDPLDPARVSEALAGGPPIERFASDLDLDEEAAEAEAATDDPLIGYSIGDRYVVDTVIGEGGMGRVYRAHHHVIGKPCAIKVLHAELAKDKESVGRFVREAKTASNIGNPHIVDISDFGELSDGSTYFVMEYLDGATLTQLRDGGPLEPRLIAHLGMQLADGLSAAHEQGIVHRDLKPDNIVVIERADDSHFVKILDFGIAKVSSGNANTKLTMAGAVFGTPHYMSPEQAAGSAIDGRSDLYALGVLLYEMASGKLPFEADNFMGILTQHLYKAPTPIRELPGRESFPAALEAIILKCLAKRPSTRYRSMKELEADLQRWNEGLEPLAMSDPASLSARLSVPAEFLNTADATVVPALGVEPRRLWRRVVFGVGIGLALGAALFVTLRNRASSPARQAASAPTGTVIEAPPTMPSSSPRMVLIHSPTAGAVAVLDGESMQLPTNLEVPADETLSLEISAPGHRSETVEVTGEQRRIEVALTPTAAFRRPPPDEDHLESEEVDGVVDPWPEDR